jgi:hypothetical protein
LAVLGPPGRLRDARDVWPRLEALLWGFHNAKSGLCFPSYERIAEAAGCARSTVAEALKALEASSRRCSKQIGQTTDPDALRAQAQALQALPAKLSEAQAGQALEPLLKQMGQRNHPDALAALAEALRRLVMRPGFAAMLKHLAGNGARTIFTPVSALWPPIWTEARNSRRRSARPHPPAEGTRTARCSAQRHRHRDAIAELSALTRLRARAAALGDGGSRDRRGAAEGTASTRLGYVR